MWCEEGEREELGRGKRDKPCCEGEERPGEGQEGQALFKRGGG